MGTSKQPEKILGVLGGMGPAATAEFLRLLTVRAPVSSDQEHPTIYMISDPAVPDRSSAIIGKGEDPTERLQMDLETLSNWGADILAVPCNTAHFFIDGFRDHLCVPLIHIIEETVDAADALNPEGAWLLATRGTMESGLYQKYAAKKEYSFFVPPLEVQEQVQRSIELVKENRLAEAGELLRPLVENLWREREIPICAACTELPLAYDASGLPGEKTVSSLQALCDACLRELYPRRKDVQKTPEAVFLNTPV
ncbi:MAG: aspartate/glutamate racemase family protein [Synergistaceae bacterium]|nr:aspartate/glutamate racemase family protein [Synergistaceae bacterium]